MQRHLPLQTANTVTPAACVLGAAGTGRHGRAGGVLQEGTRRPNTKAPRWFPTTGWRARVSAPFQRPDSEGSCCSPYPTQLNSQDQKGQQKPERKPGNSKLGCISPEECSPQGNQGLAGVTGHSLVFTPLRPRVRWAAWGEWKPAGRLPSSRFFSGSEMDRAAPRYCRLRPDAEMVGQWEEERLSAGCGGTRPGLSACGRDF